MITWRETIDVIKETFGISQKQLAAYLHTTESVLSRIRNGKANALFDHNVVFQNVFDPNNKDSPANALGETEDDLLIILKEIIENKFKNVQKALSDYKSWETTDYESFVLKWLRRTGKTLTPEDRDYTEGLESPAEAPAEQMVRIFEQAISEYHISAYLYNLPDYLMDGFPLSTQYFDMENFIKTIQNTVLEKFFAQQTEDVFIKIREFNHALESYEKLCNFQVSVLDRHGIIWASGMNITDDAIIAAIEIECAKIENNSHQNFPEEKEEMGKELFQLGANREIIAVRKRLCELFEEICPGKRLLVF